MSLSLQSYYSSTLLYCPVAVEAGYRAEHFEVPRALPQSPDILGRAIPYQYNNIGMVWLWYAVHHQHIRDE